MLLLVSGMPPSPEIPIAFVGYISASHHATKYPSRIVFFAADAPVVEYNDVIPLHSVPITAIAWVTNGAVPSEP